MLHNTACSVVEKLFERCDAVESTFEENDAAKRTFERGGVAKRFCKRESVAKMTCKSGSVAKRTFSTASKRVLMSRKKRRWPGERVEVNISTSCLQWQSRSSLCLPILKMRADAKVVVVVEKKKQRRCDGGTRLKNEILGFANPKK